MNSYSLFIHYMDSWYYPLETAAPIHVISPAATAAASAAAIVSKFSLSILYSHQSLETAAAVADVVALIISPAATAAASDPAIVSKVSLSILYSHHHIYSMIFINYMNSYSNANI